ncbi:MAG: tetratricopeptide repeat protein [Candidatus Binatia bacterium]|nr:tetratricopeptide repeat protein [Candidatus Binatia bacterium]
MRDQPDLPHAWLDLGIAYLSLGKLDDARVALERAVEKGQERQVAQFFLGLVLYRQGNVSAAAELFRAAQADPEVRLPAMYYEALLTARQGQAEAARPMLETVAREAAAAEIGQAAARYLEGIRWGLAPEAERAWSVAGRIALEYDSNVTLGPSTVTVVTPRDITEQADGRVVGVAALRYRFLSGAPFHLSGGYEFSQSVHFDLRRFDLQGHRLGLAATSQHDRWAYGASAAYNFFALDYSSFFHEGLLTPWAALRWSDQVATQAFLDFRGRDFLRRPYDPGRDAWNYSPGLRQYFGLGRPQGVFALGYRYEIEDTVSNGPQGRAFAYKGHVFDAEVHWLVADALQVESAYVYRRYDYDNRASGFGARKRSDNAHEFALGLSYPLTEHAAWTIAYIGQVHDSNEPLFEYDRHIVSTGLQLKY